MEAATISYKSNTIVLIVLPTIGINKL